MTKDVLTTKLTKPTKGSDILLINFVLFVSSFVVKSAFSFWLRLCRARFFAVKKVCYKCGMISLAQTSRCSISSNIGLKTMNCAPARTIS